MDKLNKKTFYVGGGCFWGVQKWFDRLPIVISTEVGYAQAKSLPVTYEQVCSGTTNAVEVCKVVVNNDENAISTILTHLFAVIDPFVLNRQGNDIGSQYRTGFYANDDQDLLIAQQWVNKWGTGKPRKVHFEVKKLINYQPAEQYHQDYLQKNPNGYCHIHFDD